MAKWQKTAKKPPITRSEKAPDLERLDAEVEFLVQEMDGLRIELENEVENLRITLEVNRRDTFGLKMRASEIHERAIKLLVAAYRADKIRGLGYPPYAAVAEILKADEETTR